MSDNSLETQKDNLILPTFIMMFLDVADLIFEKMSPMDLLTTRKVSRGLRIAVDKFGIRFGMIHVCMRFAYYREVFGYHDKYISLYFDKTEIQYSKNLDGDSTVTHKKEKILIENGNFVEMALNDLKLVLQSNYIKLSLNKYEKESYTNFNFFTTLIAWLESEKCVRVECIELSRFQFDEVLTILSYLDAKRLQVIHLFGEDEVEQFERITYLNQWTNNIEFELEGSQFNSDQIEHLFQIKSFKITVDEFSVQNAIKIRDDLMKRSTFNSCEIFFGGSKRNRNEIANVFDLDSTRSRPWRFKHSNDEYRFWIRITVYEEDMKYTLYVKRIETSKMQHNNLILPISPDLPLDLVAQNLDHMDRSSPQKSNNCSKMQLKGVFQPSLLSMPLDVADLVFEKMNPMDLLTIRKVCRGFRAAVDEFGVRFDRIDFEMYDTRIKMKLDEECITYYDADSGGTTVAHKERKSVVENGNFVEMALHDMMMILKHVLNLDIHNETKERDDMMITSLFDVLETEECIHVKKKFFDNISFDDVIVMLPYCDAQTLEDIWVRGNGSLDIEKLIHLDQWKMGKRFRFSGHCFKAELLQHLFHFEEIDIFHLFSVQDAIQIRDDLMRRSAFKKCDLLFDTEVFEIAKLFKPDADSDDDYDFEYSNENGRFKLGIEKYHGYYTSLIVKRL